MSEDLKAVIALCDKLSKGLDEQFDPEKLKAVIGPAVMEAIKAAGVGKVQVGDLSQPEQKETKKTFSQFLGDVARASGPQALPVAKTLGLIPAFSAGRELRDPRKYFGVHDSVPKDMRDVLKADMYETSDAAGGYLVAPQYMTEILDVSTPEWSPLLKECRQVPMKGRLMYFPTKSAGLTGYWIPEATDSTDATPTQAEGYKQRSALTLGQMGLTAYQAVVMCAVSNALLDDSDPGVDAYLRSLFQETLDDLLDTAIISGTGATTDPITGLDGKIVAANKLSVGAEFNYKDLVPLLFQIYKNIKNPGPVPLVTSALGEMAMELYCVDAFNRPMLIPSTMEGGSPRVRGEKVIRDGNVSTVLGGGADKTRIYAGAFSKSAFLGMRKAMTIKASTERLMEWNQTLFIAEYRVAFNVASGSHFAYLDGVPTA